MSFDLYDPSNLFPTFRKPPSFSSSPSTSAGNMELEPVKAVEIPSGCAMESQRGQQEDSDHTPALFMTSMPRDLWANPSLGALAVLIDEAEGEEDFEAEQEQQSSNIIDDDDREGTGQMNAPRHQHDNETLNDTNPPEAANSEVEANAEGAVPLPRYSLSTSANNVRRGSACCAVGRQRRQDVRGRRNDRRASPYDTRRQGGGGRSGAHQGGTRNRGRREGPSAGETQVLMSLWGL